MGTGFGKVIVLGEHAVVYGQPALAGAIDAQVRCTWHPRPAAPGGPPEGLARLSLRAPAWQLAVEIHDRGNEEDHYISDPARALYAVVRALSAHLAVDVMPALGSGEVMVEAALPAAAGLGSSAALAVALVRTLGDALGHRLTDDEVEHLADSAERCFHQSPSGVDVALATRGGLGVYRRGHGLDPLAAAPLSLAVGLSGRPRSTAAMVARVNAAWEADRARVDDHLVEIGQAADAGAAAMQRGDVAELGRLMNSVHTLLAKLGVSCPELDELCTVARAAGALGAKLTGAGGGGAAIAVGADDDALERVLAAWHGAGYQGFVCQVGAAGAAPAASAPTSTSEPAQ